MLESRIAQMEERVRRAIVVDKDQVDTGVVSRRRQGPRQGPEDRRLPQVPARRLGRGQPGRGEALARVADRQGPDGPQARRDRQRRGAARRQPRAEDHEDRSRLVRAAGGWRHRLRTSAERRRRLHPRSRVLWQPPRFALSVGGHPPALPTSAIDRRSRAPGERHPTVRGGRDALRGLTTIPIGALHLVQVQVEELHVEDPVRASRRSGAGCRTSGSRRPRGRRRWPGSAARSGRAGRGSRGSRGPVRRGRRAAPGRCRRRGRRDRRRRRPHRSGGRRRAATRDRSMPSRPPRRRATATVTGW